MTDSKLADQVWEAWDKGEIDDLTALWLWWIVVGRRDIGVQTCELVDANVAVCGTSVSSSQLNFTSVIAKSVASNLRRHLVFPSLYLAQVFIS